MRQQTELVQIHDTRRVVARVVAERPVSPLALQVAQDTVQEMCEQGAEYGLTDAEVVKAILQPVFERNPVCDCPTCTARRAEVLGEAGNERAFATLS